MTETLKENVKVQDFLNEIGLAFIPMIGAFLSKSFGGFLKQKQRAATQGLKAAIVSIDNGIDKALAAFKKFELSNPLVQSAIEETKTVFKTLGIEVSSPEELESHVKNALFELASGIDPELKASDVEAPATVAPEAEKPAEDGKPEEDAAEGEAPAEAAEAQTLEAEKTV